MAWTKASTHTKNVEQSQWRIEAEARVRRNKQYSVEDIKLFEIDIGATSDEFEAFMEARVNHMRRVAALFVQGYPVTPPEIKGFITYHAVRLTDKVGQSTPVDLLFQETDLYFTAFDTGTKQPTVLNARGWLAFKYSDMPDFLQFEVIEYTVRYTLKPKSIKLGFGVKEDILRDLSGFNVANRLVKNVKRELVLHSTPYMMSELLRLGKSLEEVLEFIRRGERHPLTNILVNQWGNISRVALRYEFSGNERGLKVAANSYHLDLFQEGSTEHYTISKLVGAHGYLRVLLFDPTEVEALLKKRQKENPQTRFLALKILTEQGNIFPNSELEKQLLEECSKHGRVRGFLIDGAQTMLIQYSHPRGAYEAKLSLDGSLIAGRIVDARFSDERMYSLLKERSKIPSIVQDFAGVSQNKSDNLQCQELLTNATILEDKFTKGSDNQITLSDQLTNSAFENDRPAKQSVEQESEETALLEEFYFLASVVRVVPSKPSDAITISSTLPRRLSKIFPSPKLEHYSSHYAKLADLLASRQDLFRIDKDLVSLRQGAQQRISAQIAIAKVNLATFTIPTKDHPIIAVTPHSSGSKHKGNGHHEGNLPLSLR